MRILRRPAVQGHAIPATAHRPNGPFPPEVLAANPVEFAEADEPDPLANAQNDYTAPRMVRCTLCGEVLMEDETDGHGCG